MLKCAIRPKRGYLFLGDLVKSLAMDGVGLLPRAFQTIPLPVRLGKQIEVENGHHQRQIDHPAAGSIRSEQAGGSTSS
jgi:hypothetical protein